MKFSRILATCAVAFAATPFAFAADRFLGKSSKKSGGGGSACIGDCAGGCSGFGECCDTSAVCDAGGFCVPQPGCND